MRTIIKSCFGKTDYEYYEILERMVAENEYYISRGIYLIEKSNKSTIGLECLEFLLESYDNSQQFPTENVFTIKFPDYLGGFDSYKTLNTEDLYVYVSNWVKNTLTSCIASEIKDLSSDISVEGFTEDVANRIAELQSLSVSNDDKDVQISQDFKAIYEEKIKKTTGLVTGIKDIDEILGGCGEGTLTTIAGYTSHYKTTLALNMAYHNTYKRGFNVVYLSLETPKEDMLFNLLSRHSYEPIFPEYPYISHDKMRKCLLTPEEMVYLYSRVQPDLENDYVDSEGNTRPRGKLIILDESDFKSMSFTDIYAKFESIDDSVEGGIDAFFVDYIQLCKFVEGNGRNFDDNRIINSYVTFFRRMTQKFRFGNKQKKLIGVLLSQINRTSWMKASRKKGEYDLTCLADANELERGSYRVLTTYTNEDMKGQHGAQVQILKNRGGRTMWEALEVFANGEPYVFGDDVADFGMTMGGVARTPDDIAGAFDSMDSMGFGSDLGIF